MHHPLEDLDLASLRRFSGTVQHLVETRLWLRVLVGMFLGVAVGVSFGPSLG